MSSTRDDRGIYIGTSGWNYKHWRGVVYPADLKQQDWLGYLARIVNTLEINSSFYRIPSGETLTHWLEAIPSRVRLASKLWRGITHFRKLNNVEDFLRSYFDIFQAIPPRQRGPVLVQLPPQQHKDLEKLDRFLSQVRGIRPGNWKIAVEFRHDSWLSADVCKLLDRHRAALCLHDRTGQGAATAPNQADFVYLRRHGPHHGDYTGSYSLDALQADSYKIRQWARGGQTVYVYFNNDADGHAFRNAQTLQGLCDSCASPEAKQNRPAGVSPVDTGGIR